MKDKETFKTQRHIDLGDFGTREFVGAISDIRTALIDEAWFDRASSSVTHHNEPSLGWKLPEDAKSKSSADSFDQRWSADDQKRQRADPEHPRELDFDR
jgi:hypothetical protein